MTHHQKTSLYTLGDRGQTVDGFLDDVRGRTVKDQNGKDIGKVGELLVDENEHTVRYLLVEQGGFLGIRARKTLIPVSAVTTFDASEVHVDQSRERVDAAPVYAPELVDDPAYLASLDNHYRYA